MSEINLILVIQPNQMSKLLFVENVKNKLLFAKSTMEDEVRKSVAKSTMEVEVKTHFFLVLTSEK